ncbi:hypothetical protein HHI36_023611 [Cryptolaemus montrouzieri]|uniref:Uncharacterized protein n=1 Tax=Cryptolaemus montrouzieri TaxID=559131 RepID=A0ABD2PI55_9CUCU
MQATRKRREEHVEQTCTRYISPRTLGKAVTKVNLNLPTSPTKAVGLVGSEFHIAGFDENGAHKAAPPKLTDVGKKLICEFYHRDDINRQMPGMRCENSQIQKGTNIRIQKRTMIMSIQKVF